MTYLKLEQGCITQCPAAFCRMRSFINAFLEPKSFMANLLSVGWNNACSWFLRKLCFPVSPKPMEAATGVGPGSSLGVPYSETSSAPVPVLIPKCTFPLAHFVLAEFIIPSPTNESDMSNVSSSRAVTNESVQVFVFSMLIFIFSSLCWWWLVGRDRMLISSCDWAAPRGGSENWIGDATRPLAKRRLRRVSRAPPSSR